MGRGSGLADGAEPQNWNVNIQHTLFSDVLWEVGYFGNKMNHVMGRWDESARVCLRPCARPDRRA